MRGCAPAQNARAKPLAQIVLKTKHARFSHGGVEKNFCIHPEVFVHEAVEKRVEAAVCAREIVAREVGGAIRRALRMRRRRLAHSWHQVVKQHECLQRQPAHHETHYDRHRDLERLK